MTTPNHKDTTMATTPIINVTDVAFARFNAPDLDLMEAFLIDFGLVRSERTEDTLYMRGTDDEGFVHVTHLADNAGFIGLAFNAESTDDLETLSSAEGFSEITDLDGPGGGRVVTATDPNGFQVEVVADRGSVGGLEVGRQSVMNDGTTNDRRGAPLRVDPGPSQVKRLGHVVLEVHDFRESEAWYKDRFGLVTSDEIVLKDDSRLGAFLRCDAGERYVDHHTLFLINAGKASFNHAAYEVANLDDLMAGHTHLTITERQHQWGIGRHLLGSQIYDYWYDPFGQALEHWTDGDLFNHDTPPNTATTAELMSSQWGPTHSTPGL
jgi:catechol 2,3-dioxygenase-like lactoylglutathione lyase family enzyme